MVMIYNSKIEATTGLKKQPRQNWELCNIEKSLVSNAGGEGGAELENWEKECSVKSSIIWGNGETLLSTVDPTLS